jgi:hypothetical protein
MYVYVCVCIFRIVVTWGKNIRHLVFGYQNFKTLYQVLSLCNVECGDCKF